jgi:hypothetical protein
LIFEYIDIKKGFAFIANNADSFAHLIITIQANNGNQSVSQTSVESIKCVKNIFNAVDQNELKKNALMVGFEIISSEEHLLPSGKSFITYQFKNR